MLRSARDVLAGLAVLFEATAGCSSGHQVDTTSPAAAEVGIIDIPPTTYELNHAPLTSSPTRLFYSYHPATVSPDTAPLFVASGGGPGAAMLFLLDATGPYGIANSETTPSIAVNADSLTDLAHLLYVDARNAGLSWTELPNPSSELVRRAEFGVQNYNVFVDAADVLSAVLAFLEAHPSLARRDVYFLTESYGGARTSVMLNFLLDHVEYARNDLPFHSPDLDQRIDRYMKEQLGDRSSQEDVAHRFAGQILLQSILAGARQNEAAGTLFEKPGSIMDQLAVETGVPYVRCSTQIAACNPFDNAQAFLQRANRSRYDSRSDTTWLTRYVALTARIGSDPAALAAIANVAAPNLGAVLARKGAPAYRFGKPAYGASAVRGSSETTWGALEPWDAYFTPLNDEVLAAFYSQPARDAGVDPKADHFGELFLRNVRYVPTMVTRAQYDLEIYGPAIPPALATFPDVARVTELDSSEELSVQYSDGIERRIFSPWYHQSSHSVARDEGKKLHADIGAFLKRR